MAGMVFDNAIAWAHFRLRGGWKQTGWVAGGYLLLAGLAIFMTSRMSPATALSGWTNILLGLQFLMLALYGSSAIGGAIRKDIASGLIESHRLMPVAPSAVVLGYIAGPAKQALSLAIVNVILGAATTAAAGFELRRWVLANIVVFLFVLFVWVVIAYAAFLARNATALVVILMSVGGASGGFLLAAVPGLMILATPLSGRTVFGMLDASDVLTKGYAFSFVAQTAIGAIFFCGAIRKYRRPDGPALGPILGLLLLAAWVALSAVGILDWEDFAPRYLRSREVSSDVQLIASLVASLLIAILPVSVAAWNWAQWRNTLRPEGEPPARAPLPPLVAVMLASGIIFILCVACTYMVPENDLVRRSLTGTAVVTLSFLTFVCYMLRILFRTARKPGVLVGFLVIVWWLLPFGLDLVRRAAAQPSYDDSTLTGLSTASPLGALIVLWTRPLDVTVTGGLVAQGLIALVPLLLFYGTAKPRTGPVGVP